MSEVASNRVPPSPTRAFIGRAAELEAIDAFLGPARGDERHSIGGVIISG